MEMDPATKEIIRRLEEGLVSVDEVMFFLDHPEFEHRPVGIHEFITSPDYLNAADECWPAILEDLEEIFNEPPTSRRLSHFQEIVRDMGIGSGKSFRVTYIFCYAVYRLLCLREPQRFYPGLAKGSKIALVNTSLSAPQAKRVVFGDIVERVKNSPWFQKYALPDPTVQSELRFPKNIVIFPASSSETAPLGYNIFMANIDEASFFTQTDTHDVAQEIHDGLDRRITSRFGEDGLLCVISSPRYVDDFTERKMEEARTNPLVSAKRRATWENKPEDIEMIARGETFELVHPQSGETVKIPKKYEKAFRRNPMKAWRDFGAVASLALDPYLDMNEQERIAAIVAAGAPVPCVANAIDPSFAPEPGLMYYVHIDLGQRRDACGFAMGAMNAQGVVKVPLILRIVSELRAQELRAGGQTFDMILGRDQISFDAVREIVYALSERGFPIMCVSYDQFQSVDSRQILEGRGYLTKLISVDRDMKGYDTFKDLLNMSRFNCCAHAHFLLECKRLELRDGKKVDHPPHGSKDCADAVAGVCLSIAESFDVVVEEEEVQTDDFDRVEVTPQI
jgi:hypothetical protein